MSELLAKLQVEYPDLYDQWVNYCSFHDVKPDGLSLAMLKLWLEKRHPDFLIWIQ